MNKTRQDKQDNTTQDKTTQDKTRQDHHLSCGFTFTTRIDPFGWSLISKPCQQTKRMHDKYKGLEKENFMFSPCHGWEKGTLLIPIQIPI